MLEVFVRVSASTSADVAENQQLYQRIPRPILPTTESGASSATLIKMSSVSQFVGELRHTLNTEGMYGVIRADVVEQIRHDMQSGQLGSDEEIQRAVDSLLRSL